jgi:DNA-binding XRE family transcriptional regulator
VLCECDGQDVPPRSEPPASFVVRGSWRDGDAVFRTGSRAGDEALRRLNRSAVAMRKKREEDLKVSLETLAAWAGVRRETISRFENGQSSPDALTVHRIAVALGFHSDVHDDPDARFGPR